MNNREDVQQALTDLGWETKTDPDHLGTVIGSHGKYHIVVSFKEADPTSVIISYVGRGGGMLSRKWPGKERLPTPRRVIQALSKHK